MPAFGCTAHAIRLQYFAPVSTVNVNLVVSPSGGGSYHHPDDASC